MKIPFLNLQRGFDEIAEEVDSSLAAVSRSGHYILGPNVKALEEDARQYLGVEHCITCASGTDALHLAVVATGIGPGDEVITTPFTFAATVEAIEYVGATSVLVDIEPDTFNIDPERVAAAVSPKTRGIIPVHLFGLPANMDALMEIAAEHDLVVIEDAAQSMGATISGQQVGSIGTAGSFSFYPSKTLGCFGDGGMISCRDDLVYERLLELRNHGFDPQGQHVRLGYNSRLDEMQAAILRIKLPRLNATNKRRREIAAHYNEVLSTAGAEIQANPDGYVHACGYYTLCVDDRDRVRKSLAAAGVHAPTTKNSSA